MFREQVPLDACLSLRFSSAAREVARIRSVRAWYPRSDDVQAVQLGVLALLATFDQGHQPRIGHGASTLAEGSYQVGIDFRSSYHTDP
jgi:hypothetical protein